MNVISQLFGNSLVLPCRGNLPASSVGKGAMGIRGCVIRIKPDLCREVGDRAVQFAEQNVYATPIVVPGSIVWVKLDGLIQAS